MYVYVVISNRKTIIYIQVYTLLIYNRTRLLHYVLSFVLYFIDHFLMAIAHSDPKTTKFNIVSKP